MNPEREIHSTNRKTKERTIRIVALVILPSIAIILGLYSNEIAFYLDFDFISILFSYTIIIIFFIMLGLYAPYPIIYSSEQYFKKQGYENIIKENQEIRKILYISIPILVSLTIFVFISSEEWFQSVLQATTGIINPISSNNDLLLIQLVFLFLVFSAFLRIYLQIIKKDFRYYFAKVCFTIAMREKRDVEKWRLFLMGLRSYDLYLRRHIDSQIIALNKIYEKIMTSTTEEMDRVIISITEAFEIDKMEPLRVLSSVLKAEYPQNILEKESLWIKIKQLGLFLAAAVPILISILQYIPKFIEDFWINK